MFDVPSPFTVKLETFVESPYVFPTYVQPFASVRSFVPKTPT